MSMDKKRIRKEIKALKMRCSAQERQQKSLSVWNRVEECVCFQKAKVVLVYWSMDDEVCTHDFIRKWAQEKRILLPCVRGEELEIRCYEGEDQLTVGDKYDILEPAGEQFVRLEEIDVVLVPGVAFDKDNNRLGRGKGYYDKILSKIPACKIGVCFDFQFLEKVPVAPHDICMDMVICDKK